MVAACRQLLCHERRGPVLYSENAKTAVTTLGVHPATCPAGLDAQAAEEGGADLVRGDGHHLPSSMTATLPPQHGVVVESPYPTKWQR